MKRRAIITNLSLIAASGCAAPDANTPSLLPRAIEQRSDAEPVQPVAVATPDAALDAKLATFSNTIDTTGASFDTAMMRTKTLVSAARNAGVGSNAWLDAQTSLAELDSLRADSLSALTDLDQLTIDRAADLAPAYPALDALRARTQGQVDSQTAAIAAFQAQLPGA